MKRHLRKLALLGFASLLGACAQTGVDSDKSQFQFAAEKKLMQIAVRLSNGKGGGSVRGAVDYNSYSAWVPQNNVYMQPSIAAESQECNALADPNNATAQNFQAMVDVFYQCSIAVLQYRNSFNTALYRNLGDDPYQLTSPQTATQYSWSWRYPYQYGNYQNVANNYQQFQNQYGTAGYIPTTVTYSASNPTQYSNPFGYGSNSYINYNTSLGYSNNNGYNYNYGY